MNNEIALNLGEKSYKIRIGAGEINYLPNFLQQKNYSKIFIITDENVARLHLAQLESILQGLNITTIKVASGEQSKSFASLEKTCEEILQQNVDRKSLIIAFGGGVVGDLAGFIASILLRGVDFIQVPTTLLACVDSSVGGKTAINSKSGKNLIGSFYQPKLVICDLNFLATLPQREFRAGYAEALKYGLIDDAEFFDFLDQNLDKIFVIDQNGSQKNFVANKQNSQEILQKTFTGDQKILQKIITKSCEIKARIVSQDEKENGVRALLNFGHTFAHSFENELNYSNDLLHGEAVGIGMLMAA
ncbi:MAG: 3-dehydroquinate synthase, partial [Rickettsiales bacterium]|nr:3-dehydroquinate synthase [Rickettsiales bacterium]